MTRILLVPAADRGGGADLVGVPGGQPRPLGGGAAAEAELPAVQRERPRPALRGVLPRLLAAVQGDVEQPVAGRPRLRRPARAPVGLVDPVVVITQVTD